MIHLFLFVSLYLFPLMLADKTRAQCYLLFKLEYVAMRILYLISHDIVPNQNVAAKQQDT